MKAPVNANSKLTAIINLSTNMKANLETTTMKANVNVNTNMTAQVNALTRMNAQLNATI